MKRKSIKCALIIITFFTFFNPIMNLQNNVVIAEETETRAYIYEWRYKVIDGHFYKRLFNCTKEEWVGDWILVQ